MPESKIGDRDFEISESRYGKNCVKILYLSRNGEKIKFKINECLSKLNPTPGLVHTIKELEVSTSLSLATQKDYLEGDNSDIVATDSQKNTVYILAKKFGVKSPEHFGSILCHHFIATYGHVTKVGIYLEEVAWERIKYDESDGKAHNHAFLHTPICKRYSSVALERDEKYPSITSGLKDLRILKSTQSSFVNFVDDEYRSLGDFQDRIFSTVVDCSWEYNSNNPHIDFCRIWKAIQLSIFKNFAGDLDVGVPSPSVQYTIYVTEKDVLKCIKEVKSISMTLPNKHYVGFDFSKFEKIVRNDEETVFVPLDKPSGCIYAKLDRRMNKLWENMKQIL